MMHIFNIKFLSGKTVLSLFVVAMISCNGCGEKKEMSEADIEKAQRALIKENKKHHEQEIKTIDKFIQNKKWPMEQTKTGLRYWIYENGTGSRPKEEDIAALSYTITLLDGTKCYETTDAEPSHIRIGRDNVESGLHEAIQLMRVGDKAKFILPSHLAFGFTGDSGKIPANASVIYDVHLISLQ